MKKIIVSGLVVLAFLSCSDSGGKKGWSQENKDAFLKECISGSQKSANLTKVQAKEYCDCMLSKLETKYPNALTAAMVTDAEMGQFADSCNK